MAQEPGQHPIQLGDSRVARRLGEDRGILAIVGRPERWPESFRAAIDMALAAPYPIHVWWGSELAVFANDAGVAAAGWEPETAPLGSPARLACPALWAAFFPRLDLVLKHGRRERVDISQGAPWSPADPDAIAARVVLAPIAGGKDGAAGMVCIWEPAPVATAARGKADNDSTRRIAELEDVNAAIIDSRRAALNLLEDAVAAQRALADENGERRRAEESLRESEERFRLLVESIEGHAIFTLDDDGNIAAWNAGAQRILGYTAEELVGRPVSVLYPEDVRGSGRLERELEAARTKGSSVSEEWLVCRDGRRFWASGTTTMLRWAGGQRRGFVKIVRDLTERKNGEDALRESYSRLQLALDAARDASQAKDRFLAALSHELRTPLTPVLLTVSMLEDDESVPNGLRTQIGMMRRNVEIEARMVDDLLDLSRIMNQKLQLDRRIIDVHEIVERALETCAPVARQKRLAVAVDLRARHSRVEADGPRLQQVFWNLIQNAVKFTPAGGQVTVRSSDDGDRLRVEISDTGSGIEESMLERIFEPFEQGKRTEGESLQGLGLGLAISKRIITAHGGTLSATSAGSDRGSTFSVELTAADDGPGRPHGVLTR